MAEIDDCPECAYYLKDGNGNREEVQENHDNCHGWYHCGDECCGPCPDCGK